LFGFIATFGLLRLLCNASVRDPAFARDSDSTKVDFCAVLTGVSSVQFLEDTVWGELQAFRERLTRVCDSVEKPADLTKEIVDQIASSGDRCALDELAELGYSLAGEADESTLCAANGEGHQKLILSMRDVLALLERYRHLLRTALICPWALDFEPSDKDCRELQLGNSKPTLRFDPSDERLYALRFEDPTSNDASYRTELGAQALAAAAFGGLPLVPQQQHPVTIGSEAKRNRTYLCWGLRKVPASFSTIRSSIAVGLLDPAYDRARGFFAAFRAARVTGSKGKLSFAPTEPWW
jgi:hypothetical protein